MADSNPKVMDMVETELKKNGDISNAELFDKAVGIDAGIRSLSARQFNAKYPLQVKRALKPRKRTPRGKKDTGKRKAGGTSRGRAVATDRDRVRTVLLELAKDIAGAEGKADVVDVVAGIDRYVDRVVKAAG